MAELDLLKSLPKVKRDIKDRATLRNNDIVEISKQFGEMYFDGPREYGYGGYFYDGRWLSVAQDIARHYKLAAGQRVLDVGCAKGFLVKDLMAICPGLEVFGMDISEYALKNCEKEAIGRLHLGSAVSLPFPSESFDLVLSINTLHNLDKNDLIRSLKEINRVSKGYAFIQVDAYHTEREKALFMDWVLTAKFHGFPIDWFQTFEESGYKGDWGWTVLHP